MKKAVFIISILISAYLITAYSQSEKIKEIDEYCEKIKSKIPVNENDLSYYYQQKLHYISNFRAIGRQDTRVIFYYPHAEDEYYEDGEETKFKLNYFPPEIITISYNIAASMDVKITYYFNEGQLLLYHGISKGVYYCIEEKYYFEGKTLLKIKTEKPSDCTENEVLEEKPVYEKDNGFNEEEKSKANTILKNALEYKKTFFSLVELESLDK